MQYHNQTTDNTRALLKRFVSDMPETIACEFDPIKMLLRINAGIYVKLTDRQKQRVWRAKDNMSLKEARA